MSRTIREQYLLRPCDETRELILGVIGRALALFPLVRLYAFTYLSNHFHMLLSADDGKSVPEFIGYVNGNIARAIGRFRKSRGKLWGGRIHPVPILDDDSLLERFLYVVGQGCKEGLVASPREWPGASSVPGLLGEPLEGRWLDRDAWQQACRRKSPPPMEEFVTTYPIDLEPLPIWKHLSRDARVAKHASIIAAIERKTRDDNRRLGRTPLGVAKILAQDPFGRPDDPAHEPTPLCHASTETAEEEYRAAYDAFVAAFHAAALVTRSRPPRAPFPPCSFPSPARFVPPSLPNGHLRGG